MAAEPDEEIEGSASQDPIADVVKRYVIEHVRSLPAADPDLMDRAFALYDAVESAHAAGRATEKLRFLVDHPSLKGLLRVLGKRAAHVFEVGVRMASDNRRMMDELRERAEEKGIDASTPEGRVEATAEYERVLVDQVSYEQSLANVDGVVESIELAGEFLNPKSRIKRGLFESAFKLLLPVVVSNASLREDVVSLKEDLAGEPERLQAMAELVREAGPGIVQGAYRRGGSDHPDVLTSAEP